MTSVEYEKALDRLLVSPIILAETVLSLIESSQQKRHSPSVNGVSTLAQWKQCGVNCFRKAIDSTPSGMIGALVMRPTLFPENCQTTVDIFFLDVEARLIEPPVRLFTSMMLYFAANGVLLAPPKNGVMTLSSDGPLDHVQGVLAEFWSAIG